VIVEFTVTGSLFLLGLRWGPEGIAMAWTASFWILTIPAFWYAGKPINLGFGPVLSAVWKYVVASAAAGVAAALILRQIPWFAATPSTLAAAEHIAVISLLFAGLYLAAVVLLYGGLAPIHQVTGLLREALPSRKPSAPAPQPIAEESANLMLAEEEAPVASGE